jgi:putative tryptophan/tyrosine transport system substrate-binding protein
MRRRQFITLLGGAAVAWPLAARAQQPKKVPRIGLLVTTNASASAPRITAFVQRLRQLGWIEGQTVAIEYRWAEGQYDRFAEIAAEFVRLKVDVIVTAATAPVLAAKQATSSIPIVFAVSGDPVGSGLVASLARPGGNVTGLSLQQAEVGSKRLELLREIVPDLRRLAIIANVSSPMIVLEVQEVESKARSLALEVVTLQVDGPDDISRAFETASQVKADALYVCSDPLTSTNRGRIYAAAQSARLPSVSSEKDHIDAGALVSYGPNFPDLFRRASEYVDKILRGAKPSDLPVEQPTKFELVINLRTARVLGLTVPPALLARADEVIE